MARETFDRRKIRQHRRARDTGRGGEIDDEEEGEVGRPHGVSGGAAARDEAGEQHGSKPTTTQPPLASVGCVEREEPAAPALGRGGEVGGQEEDEVDELRVVGGAAVARDEAGAVMVKSPGNMVSVGLLCRPNVFNLSSV